MSVNKNAGVIAYADPDTIRRKGDLVKMWSLFDLHATQTAGGNSHSSVKALQKYDCAEERSRALAHRKFSGNMGHGKVVYSNLNEGKWAPVAPMSVGQELWKVACGKK
ncbi:MAG: surface-adhesin E family protein [Nitrospirota bacterium]